MSAIFCSREERSTKSPPHKLFRVLHHLCEPKLVIRANRFGLTNYKKMSLLTTKMLPGFGVQMHISQTRDCFVCSAGFFTFLLLSAFPQKKSYPRRIPKKAEYGFTFVTFSFCAAKFCPFLIRKTSCLQSCCFFSTKGLRSWSPWRKRRSLSWKKETCISLFFDPSLLLVSLPSISRKDFLLCHQKFWGITFCILARM